MTASRHGPAWAAAAFAAVSAHFGELGAIGTALTAALAWGAATWWQHRRAERWRAHLAHTAHELRTPLTSILSALELVRQGHASSAAEIDEFLGEAELAARHLAFLVDDVLDDAALTHDRLHVVLADHALRLLLADGERVLGHAAQRRGIAIEWPKVPAHVRVHADARRCLQVLFNLIGNAIKFSAPGSGVRITFEVRRDAVRIAVIDDGPGVPAGLRDRLFQPFAHGAGTAPGTGLGLFLCRRLVTAMHGTIGHEARPRGACFWFELPTAKAAIAPDPLLAE